MELSIGPAIIDFTFSAVIGCVSSGFTSAPGCTGWLGIRDRKSTRLNSSHGYISYAVFCLKKKTRLKAAINLSQHDEPRSTLDDERGAVESLGMPYCAIPRDFGRPTVADPIVSFAAAAAHR